MAGDKTLAFQMSGGGQTSLLSTGERLELGKMLSAQDEVVGVDLRLPKKPIYLQSREWKIRPLCFCTGEEFIKSHTELFLYN